MLTQDEYKEYFAKERQQMTESADREGISRYASEISVGNYVRVTADGPGVHCGRVAWITDRSICVVTEDGDYIEYQGRYLRTNIKIEKSFMERVAEKEQELHIKSIPVGSTISVTYERSCSSVFAHVQDVVTTTGVLKKFLVGAIVIDNNGEELCIPVLIMQSWNYAGVSRETAIKQCRDNAPSALLELSDDELLETMKPSLYELMTKP